MVRITEELVRKKSEHNECIINSLEELSLHQEDVDKIEHLQNWCKELKILYLQSNLISKIENLGKLKKLEYLNLAINNVEKIENLQRCESLEKLDLTLNFIGDLESVCTLKSNFNLKHLYLTGNPCTDYEGYRPYVIAQLRQLETLDCVEITRTERIKAQQQFSALVQKIQLQQDSYVLKREKQKKRLSDDTWNMDDETFWKTTSEHAPETRVEISKRHRKVRGKDVTLDSKIKKSVRLFAKDGRPLNVNQSKINFTFSDDNPEEYVLDLHVYKYLDTTLIEVDVQPIYVRIAVKGKIFQIVLPEEIYTDRSVAQRSQTTGHLVVKMPRVNFKPKPKETTKQPDIIKGTIKREFLDVQADNSMDFSKITANKEKEMRKFSGDLPPPLEFV